MEIGYTDTGHDDPVSINVPGNWSFQIQRVAVETNLEKIFSYCFTDTYIENSKRRYTAVFGDSNFPVIRNIIQNISFP